jgi:hypothetical protein
MRKQFRIRWPDETHPFDWIDVENVRPPSAKIGDDVIVRYFDSKLYPGKVVATRTLRDPPDQAKTKKHNGTPPMIGQDLLIDHALWTRLVLET